MLRKRDRIKSFWGEVGQALGLEDRKIQTTARSSQFWDDLKTHLVGTLSGFVVEAGVHHSQGGEGGADATFTYAAVTVGGLPPGLKVGPWRAKQPRQRRGAKRLWIDCEEGGGKVVWASRGGRTRVETGGLVTEHKVEAFDLDTYLTPRRRQVICSLQAELAMFEGAHQLRTTLPGLPYPRRRDIARAARGDVDATHRLGASRDKIAEAVRATVREAELVVRELSEDGDSQ